jgi:hypothetical protein
MLSEGGKWDATVEDSVALLGAHTIMSTQGCSKDGPKIDMNVALNDRKTCTGRVKAFTWTNDYFKVLSPVPSELSQTACGQAIACVFAHAPQPSLFRIP